MRGEGNEENGAALHVHGGDESTRESTQFSNFGPRSAPGASQTRRGMPSSTRFSVSVFSAISIPCSFHQRVLRRSEIGCASQPRR
jgi:hypothetical protein